MNNWKEFNIVDIPDDFYHNPRYLIEKLRPDGTWMYSMYNDLISRKDIERTISTSNDKFRYKLSEEVPRHDLVLSLWWDIAKDEIEGHIWAKCVGYKPKTKEYLFVYDEYIDSYYLLDLIPKKCVLYPPEGTKQL